jgi:hypothetical protein
VLGVNVCGNRRVAARRNRDSDGPDASVFKERDGYLDRLNKLLEENPDLED